MTKTSIIYVILLFGTNYLFGQKVFSLQQAFKNETTKFLGWDDNELLVSGNWQDEIGQKSTGIISLKFYKDSLKINNKTQIKGENARLMHFIKKHNSNAYQGISYEEGCRYLAAGNFIYNISEKLEGSGKPTRLSYFFVNIPEPLTMVEAINESTLILGNNKLIISYNIQTRKAIAFNDSLVSYSNLIPISDDRFVCTENNKFHIFNSLCNLVSSSNMGFAPKQLSKIPSSSGYLGISDQNLVVLNNGGQAIYSHNWLDLNIVFDTLERFFWHQDTLMMLGVKNHKWLIAQLNVKFEIINSYPLPFANKKPIDIICKGNFIYTLVKNYGTRGQRIDNIAILNRNKHKNFLGKNVSITGLKIDSIASYAHNSFLNPRFYVAVQITNYDTSAIKSVFLNWRSSADDGCRAKTFSQKIVVNLNPSQVGSFQISFIDSFLNPETLYEICLRLSSVDGNIVSVLATKTACFSQLLPPLTIGELHQKTLITQSVFHGNEQVHTEQYGHLMLVDLMGKTFDLGKGSAFTIPTILAEGIYFLRFQGNNTHLCKQIYIIN